jgi:acetyl esterase/lipase
MPLDSHVRRFLDKLAAATPRRIGALDIAQRRASLERLMSLAGSPEEVGGVQERTAPGPAGPLRLRIYTPRDTQASALPGLVYFHGGGLVAGSLDTHDGICRSLANSSGCRLVSVDYRLAPEARFPAAVDDACAATRWTAAHAPDLGIDPGKLGICGDSAGATLAAVACAAICAQGTPKLAFQFLLCPILDYAADTDSWRTFGDGYLLDRDTLAHDLAHYLGPSDDPSDPMVSPLRAATLEGLPPSCIHTAECDPLRDEGVHYAERLGRAGVRVSHRCHPGMVHLFYGLGGVIPQGRLAYRAVGADIRALVH